jgi:hypothetical protein
LAESLSGRRTRRFSPEYLESCSGASRAWLLRS